MGEFQIFRVGNIIPMGVVVNVNIVRRGSNNQIYAIGANSMSSQNIIIEDDNFITRIEYN